MTMFALQSGSSAIFFKPEVEVAYRDLQVSAQAYTPELRLIKFLIFLFSVSNQF